jgi:hypothetical protein
MNRRDLMIGAGAALLAGAARGQSLTSPMNVATLVRRKGAPVLIRKLSGFDKSNAAALWDDNPVIEVSGNPGDRVEGGIATASPGLKLIGSIGRFPLGAYTPAGTHTSWQARIPVMICNDAVDFSAFWDNKYVTDINKSELYSPNDLTITKAALEKEGTALCKPILFAGGRSVTAIRGAQVQSDLLPASAFGQSKFSRGELYWLRLSGTLPSGGSIPVCIDVQWPGAKGEDFDLTTGVDYVDGTGAMPSQVGATTRGQVWGPSSYVGHLVDPSSYRASCAAIRATTPGFSGRDIWR